MSKRALQEPTYLILTSLAAGPQHGYGIMTDVEQISDGRVKLRAGTLYVVGSAERIRRRCALPRGGAIRVLRRARMAGHGGPAGPGSTPSS